MRAPAFGMSAISCFDCDRLTQITEPRAAAGQGVVIHVKCSASITRYVGLAVCTRHPEDIVRAIIVGRPRHDKKQIGKTVEIFDSFYIDRLRR